MATNSVNLAASAVPAEKLAFAPAKWTAVDTNSNAATSANVVAVAGQQHFATHVTVSFSTVPATALTLTIKDGTTVIWQVELSTTNTIFTENFETRPLHASTNAALSANVGAAGTGVTSTISLAGFTAMAP